MAIYDETMAPGYARWRTVHPQLLDTLIVHSANQLANSALLMMRKLIYSMGVSLDGALSLGQRRASSLLSSALEERADVQTETPLLSGWCLSLRARRDIAARILPRGLFDPP